MNASQMEMLSVKSAIERTIFGIIAATNNIAEFDRAPTHVYDEICRYMASLFASRQIDRDYTVCQRNPGSIEVTFWSRGNHSSVSFCLPKAVIDRRPTPAKTPADIIEAGRWDLCEKTDTQPETYVG